MCGGRAPASAWSGIKISDKAKLAEAGQDVSLVARRATESYLRQVLITGFFHAGGPCCRRTAWEAGRGRTQPLRRCRFQVP